MLGNRNKKKRKIVANSLIGQDTEVRGDIVFNGGLHIDGKVSGNIQAPDDSGSVLTVSELGHIEGEVRVPDIVLNGTVEGDVYGCDHIELAAKARITGNVYYNLIEVAMGAEVNGSLVHSKQAPVKALEHKKKKDSAPAEPPPPDFKNNGVLT